MSGNETPTRGHIQINNVSKIYDPDGAKVLAVDRCTMDIAPASSAWSSALRDAAKSTLLNAIAGFHSISSGEILLDGEVLCSADKQAQPAPTASWSSRTARCSRGSPCSRTSPSGPSSRKP